MTEPTSTISELFARDPFKCTKDDIKSIIQFYRDQRVKFKLKELSGPASKALTAKQAEVKTIAVDIDL